MLMPPKTFRKHRLKLCELLVQVLNVGILGLEVLLSNRPFLTAPYLAEKALGAHR